MSHPVIPAERYAERLARALERTAAAGIDALLVGVGPDLRYLTGYTAMPLERLTLLLLVPGEAPTAIVPRLERSAAEAGLRGGVAIVAWEETDDPYAIVAGRLRPVIAAGNRRLAVSDRLWASHLLRLQAAVGDGLAFEAASPLLRPLRMIKDPDEIALLRLAAEAADRVIVAIAAGPLVGRTEADVAREVRDRLIAEGHDEAGFSIVAAGQNAASPHHEPSDRVIEAGEPIVLDIGGSLGGYGSDISRTIWVTGGDPRRGPDETFRRIFDLVRDAQQEATASARAGVAAERIDAVARGMIAAGGFGDRFIHRLGHGIGLESHEDPYLVAGDATPIEPGMAFSIEPGIYLEGRYGVRIEDIVVATAAGPLALNQAPRELLVVDG